MLLTSVPYASGMSPSAYVYIHNPDAFFDHLKKPRRVLGSLDVLASQLQLRIVDGVEMSNRTQCHLVFVHDGKPHVRHTVNIGYREPQYGALTAYVTHFDSKWYYANIGAIRKKASGLNDSALDAYIKEALLSNGKWTIAVGGCKEEAHCTAIQEVVCHLLDTNAALCLPWREEMRVQSE